MPRHLWASKSKGFLSRLRKVLEAPFGGWVEVLHPSLLSSRLPKNFVERRTIPSEGLAAADQPDKAIHVHPIDSATRVSSGSAGTKPTPRPPRWVWPPRAPRPLEHVARGRMGGAREPARKGGERAGWVCSCPRARAWSVGGGAPVGAQGRGQPARPRWDSTGGTVESPASC